MRLKSDHVEALEASANSCQSTASLLIPNTTSEGDYGVSIELGTHQLSVKHRGTHTSTRIAQDRNSSKWGIDDSDIQEDREEQKN